MYGTGVLCRPGQFPAQTLYVLYQTRPFNLLMFKDMQKSFRHLFFLMLSRDRAELYLLDLLLLHPVAHFEA